MDYFKKFNVLRFFTLLIVIGGLTFFSFLTAFGKDEGTLGNNLFLNFMADTFYVFRFSNACAVLEIYVWQCFLLRTFY